MKRVSTPAYEHLPFSLFLRFYLCLPASFTLYVDLSISPLHDSRFLSLALLVSFTPILFLHDFIPCAHTIRTHFFLFPSGDKKIGPNGQRRPKRGRTTDGISDGIFDGIFRRNLRRNLRRNYGRTGRKAKDGVSPHVRFCIVDISSAMSCASRPSVRPSLVGRNTSDALPTFV